MNRKKFAWLLIVVLMATLFWQISTFKRIYEKITAKKIDSSDNADQNLAFLQKKLEAQERRAKNLEKLALWQTGEDLMSWLTKQADGSNVQIVGVEHPPAKKELDYHHVPVKITVTGYYNSLSRFVNRLEQSSSRIRIDSFRMRRKEEASEYATLDLSLSYFQRATKPS